MAKTIAIARRATRRRVSAKPMPVRKAATAVLFVAALLALGGCGIFGCGGAATNGAAFGGCHAGTRF